MSQSASTYIADAIRAAREDRHVPKVDVADALGVTPPIITRAESDSQRLTVVKLLQLAVALGVSPRDLVPDLEAARELLECRGIRSVTPRPPTPTGAAYIKAVVAGARDYLAKHKRPPTTKSGDATELVGFDATWDGIDSAFRRGSNGLSPGGNLRGILLEHGIVIEGAALEDAIATAAWSFYEREKRRPTRYDGDATCDIGMRWAWSGINSALISGARGTTQFCSLAVFLDRRGMPR